MLFFYYFNLIRAEKCNLLESLYRNLLDNYDKRIPATVDGNWTKIHHALDLIWINRVNTELSELLGLNSLP